MKIIKVGAIWCPGCLVMKKVWNNILKDYDYSNRGQQGVSDRYFFAKGPNQGYCI